MGRLVDEPDIRFSAGENATCIANFRIAVDKRFKNKNDADAPTADFFRITAFGKLGEFCQNYLHKGTKIVMSGRIENNNYTDTNGNKVYRDQIIAENIEFAESKKAAANANGSGETKVDDDGFMKIPDNITDDLPFK
jgi:single-strand DNA-binding protein